MHFPSIGTTKSVLLPNTSTRTVYLHEHNSENVIIPHCFSSVGFFVITPTNIQIFKSDGSASEQYVGLESDAYMGSSLKKWRIEKNTLILTYDVYIGDRHGQEEGNTEEEGPNIP